MLKNLEITVGKVTTACRVWNVTVRPLQYGNILLCGNDNSNVTIACNEIINMTYKQKIPCVLMDLGELYLKEYATYTNLFYTDCPYGYRELLKKLVRSAKERIALLKDETFLEKSDNLNLKPICCILSECVIENLDTFDFELLEKLFQLSRKTGIFIIVAGDSLLRPIPQSIRENLSYNIIIDKLVKITHPDKPDVYAKPILKTSEKINCNGSCVRITMFTDLSLYTDLNLSIN